MINRKMAVSALALTMAAGGASASDVRSGSFSAGVALLSPEQTGARYRAQLGVEGVGSGSVTVTATEARHQFSGFALSESGFVDSSGDPVAPGTEGAIPVAATNAGVLGTFDFDRSVQTSGSLGGLGNVLASGEATGASGFSGASFGDVTFAGVQGGAAFNEAAETESEAALAGTAQTENFLNLRGLQSNFAGSQGTIVGGRDTGIAFSALGVTSGVSIDIPGREFANAAAAREAFFGVPAVLDAEGEITTPAVAPLDGVAFDTSSSLTGGSIDLAISSGGGGSQLLEVDTGGFFTGGSAAFGENVFGVAEDSADGDD